MVKQTCGGDEDSYNERQYDDAALAGVVLDENGVAQLKSFTLSSCAWALGRAMKGASPGWLDGFDLASQAASGALRELLFNPRPKLSEQLLSELAKYVLGLVGTETLEQVVDAVTSLWGATAEDKAPVDTSTPPVLTADHLTDITTMLVRLTGTDEVFTDLDVRVACEEVYRREEEPTFDFLNSMLLEDLDMVRNEIMAGSYPKALRTYLAEKPDNTRHVDVREAGSAVLERLHPEKLPHGRWPSNPEHGLALHQQLAVNNAMTDLGDAEGLMGVNGPPGTGKTTLLRDVMAALVTKRAQAMARLGTPSDAFREHLQWKKGDRTFTVPVLAPELTGFEMVVASSNNGAVENVTKETPDLEAVEKRWLGEVDYFSDVGTAVLNSDQLDKPDRWRPAWGLAAAKLGRKQYRSDFVTAFWFGRKETRNAKGFDGLQQVLRAGPGPVPWRDAVARFRSAEQKVTRLQRDRERIRLAWESRDGVTARIAEAEAVITATTADQAKYNELLARQEREFDDGKRRYREREADRDAHRQRRPGFLDILMSLGKVVKPWRHENAALASRSQEARAVMDDREQAVERTTTLLRDLQRFLTDTTRQAGVLHTELDRIDQALSQAADIGVHLPDRNGTDRLHTPWTDTKLNTARSELFLEALRLHRVFLEHNRKPMSQGLASAVDAVAGSMPADVDPRVRTAAWQHLFLAVPVVSTTFASCGRMLAGLPAESLGWLLIDEAGQATPQAAVGAIWRSKRVVAVGDPLQLEPIVAMPFPVQQSLRQRASVSERWLPERYSVQKLADEATPMGTELGGLWVGTPLTVHRRCDDPMMSISNAVAYDNMMIKATPDRDPFEVDGRELDESVWLDVVSARSDGHWIFDEGAELDWKLKWLKDRNLDMKQIIMISPFRDVARQLVLRQRGFGTGPSGTVHTAQGKEADIVFLVLGGEPGNSGALKWAAEKPNLLNVAVSRAKRRLYIIGNSSRWLSLPHFNVLPGELKVKAATQSRLHR
ncbi:MAG TPA: hypothetical protein H9881_02375 [Candidatus Stackebrandtia excrementipullorum]|nr:hypothetical protein [Candidatus Stackebrandtia excrementipullorum]